LRGGGGGGWSTLERKKMKFKIICHSSILYSSARDRIKCDMTIIS
jgi:hypothetical protein